MQEFLTLFLVLALYFLPAINAKSRKHANTEAIAVANIFLGWTIIGWVFCLIWSSTSNVKQIEKVA